ncbi:MAG: proline--tRNA ligase [Candidatus Cloacimonas sp. 4484_209]|nr:MAG: proline--tRNA ligase [Candidatus Cloacimonas sp. 4484_209]
MRLSKYFLPTLKELPKEAKEISHILLLRAGLIKPLMSGVYEYLPLGWRVISKIERIIREEMNRIGGMELLLPALTNREIWDETERWDDFGKEMFKFKDRNDREISLAPTHEEIITDLARKEIQSYRQLPQIWYQIQTKFRDEPRPKGAVLRARQFIMKDSYSLDKDYKGLDKSYDLHYEAYKRIFARCGLDIIVVGASSGLMGGSQSNEFMFLSSSGEDEVVLCDKCNYAANMEVAKTILDPITGENSNIEMVHTPVPGSVEEISKLLKKPKEFFIKSLLYIANDKPVFILVRGDHNVSEPKLVSVIGQEFRTASKEEVKKLTGAEIGYISPVGIDNIDVYADISLKGATGMITGANKDYYHIKGVNIERDINVKKYIDITMINDGDICPECGKGHLIIKSAIELGHIFKLGIKYSKSMKCFFTDKDGSEKPIIMGSYGIGIERIMAAVIDKHHDNNGIIWPVSIAPFLVHIIPTDISNKNIKDTTEEIYKKLIAENIETLLDDRDERTGFKFKDADLIGIPIHIIIGERSLAKGTVEVKLRRETQKNNISINNIIDFIKNIIKKEAKQFEL